MNGSLPATQDDPASTEDSHYSMPGRLGGGGLELSVHHLIASSGGYQVNCVIEQDWTASIRAGLTTESDAMIARLECPESSF